MEQIDLFGLKSGSDVRGVASDIFGAKVQLTDDVVKKIAKAFYVFMLDRIQQPVIAIGHDSRITAERISGAVADALVECGAETVFCGLCSTPAMFMITRSDDVNADASIMITASHHPADKNGLKFFTKDGGLDGKQIEEILSIAQKNEFPEGFGIRLDYDYMPQYAELLVKTVRERTKEATPLAGKKIVVDAGNGAGGFYAERVLAPLGADVSGSQFLEPDGMFPNHVPNPENAAAMKSLCNRVKETEADLGVIFDTDVDRAGLADGFGNEINRDRLIALVSAVLLKENPGAYIVTDSVTSDGLAEFIAKKGGVHYRYKRGYRNVIDKAVELNASGFNCVLAIETSGHAALKENFFLDDGAYLATRLICELAEGRSIADLTKDLKTPKESAEIRLTFTDPDCDFKKLGNKVISEMIETAESAEGMRLAPDNREGVRISYDADSGAGWSLVRMSVHDPVMPINFESDLDGGCKIIAKKLYETLSVYPFLNLTNLIDYIGE